MLDGDADTDHWQRATDNQRQACLTRFETFVERALRGWDERMSDAVAEVLKQDPLAP